MFVDWLSRILRAVCVRKDQCSLTELQVAVNVVAMGHQIDAAGLRPVLIKLGFFIDENDVVHGLRPLKRSDLPVHLDLSLTASPARKRYLIEVLGVKP